MNTMSIQSAISIRREHLHRRGIRLEWFTVSWNVIEAFVAIGAGLVAGSTALIAFGVDGLIEVISAVALLWRLLQTGPNATIEEHGYAERRALCLVSVTFFLLAAYVTFGGILEHTFDPWWCYRHCIACSSGRYVINIDAILQRVGISRFRAAAQ